MKPSSSCERVAKNISQAIEQEIDRIGLYARIFHRVKESEHVKMKIERKGEGYYTQTGKKVQDYIGIRVVTYYEDDLAIVAEILARNYEIAERVIDNNGSAKFGPARFNIVCELPEEYKEEVKLSIDNLPIDFTFEVQLRTIFSEGWHEIDHDMRYVCSADWLADDSEDRYFNSMAATLETVDKSMIKLFEHMCYQHYKRRNIAAMIKTKYRIRIVRGEVPADLLNMLTEDYVRGVFKSDRIEVLTRILKSGMSIPMTMENILHTLNRILIKNPNIDRLANNVLRAELRQLDGHVETT